MSFFNDDIIKNQNVKLKISTKPGNYLKVIALQSTSTPGIIKKFKVFPNMNYKLLVSAYLFPRILNKNLSAFLYLVAGNSKTTNLIPNDNLITLTHEMADYCIEFNTANNKQILAGILFTYPIKGDRFYVKDINVVLSTNNITATPPKPLPKPNILQKPNSIIFQENSTISQENAKISQQNAKISQENATISQENATISQENAKISQSNIQMSLQNVAKTTIKFIFLVSGYNCSKWIDKCITSIRILSKKNWICILCDDGSTDNTWKKMTRYDNFENKIFTYRNAENMGACYTRYYAIKQYSHLIDDEDVILLIGGDDYLATTNVINILERAYYNKNAQVTYGNWRDSYGLKDHKLVAIPKHIIDQRNYRKYKWVTTAINTFKYYLFKNVTIEDYLEPDGTWIKNCTDLAVMFPVLEQATKIIPIYDILYIYNSRYAHNTIARFGLKDKRRLNRIIREKPKKPIYIKPQII